MKARTKTKSSVQETKKLFPEMKVSDMTAIDRKINALLTVEGYAIEEATRSERSGWHNDLNINRIVYLRGERERVFTITHEVIEAAQGGNGITQ